jgi:CBS domain-containing protein
VICPDCRAENIAGVDFCSNCGQDLRSFDLPTAHSEFTHHLLNDQLGDLPITEVPTVSPGQPVAFAIHVMQRGETGCVLVEEDGNLVGIMTERDVLLKAAGDKVDLNALAVRDLMTPDPVTLRDDDTLAVALHKMSIGEFRHMPVVSRNGATNVISIRDVFQHVCAFIDEEPVQPA